MYLAPSKVLVARDSRAILPSCCRGYGSPPPLGRRKYTRRYGQSRGWLYSQHRSGQGEGIGHSRSRGVGRGAWYSSRFAQGTEIILTGIDFSPLSPRFAEGMLGRPSGYLCYPWNAALQILLHWPPRYRTRICHLCWGGRRTTWYSGWACGSCKVYSVHFNGILGRLATGDIYNAGRSNAVLSHMPTPFPERLQRNHYLEELRPPECITSSRRRHVHFATLYHLSTYGPRKFERVSRAFPKRPKVKIGEGISGIQPNPSYGASSCSTSPEAWNTCMTRTVSMVT